MDVGEVRSLYAEFMGYLSQTPLPKDEPSIYNEQIWEQYNKSVKRLSEISGRDYSEFLIRVGTASMTDMQYHACPVNCLTNLAGYINTVTALA